jgi:hypothetical protein
MELLLWIVGGLILGAVGWWKARSRRDRQRELMLLCRRAGLRFAPIDPFQDRWLPFAVFGRGTDRGTENAIWEERDDGRVRAFDLWVVDEARSGSFRTRRTWTCAVAELPFTCPHLEVAPRDGVDAFAQFLDVEEVELELEAFNRRFRIRTPDRRFAVAFLDQRMMQAMLGLPRRVSLSVREDRLLLSAPLLPAGEVLLLLEAARELGSHVPRVVASLYPPRPMEGPYEDRWLQGHWSPDPTERRSSLVPPQDAG